MIDVVWLDAGADRPGRLDPGGPPRRRRRRLAAAAGRGPAAAWTTSQAGRPIALASADTSFRQWSDAAARGPAGGDFAADEDYWLRVADAASTDPPIGSRPLDPRSTWSRPRPG